MNLKVVIDFILEKILGESYTQNHVVVLMFIILFVVLITKRGRKR